MSLLLVSDIVKEFCRGERIFKAVDDVCFSMEAGEALYIAGRSGSGKSTLLQIISGILIPTSGSVTFDGMDIWSLADDEKSKYRNQSIGYVPQSLGTLPNLTVCENVELPAYLGKNTQSVKERALMLLDQMQILHLKDVFPNTLSGGELKRVLLARAMMNAPKLIIADEPTADLDRQTTKEILDLLEKIRKDGTALLIVTHEGDVLERVDRVLHMQEGRLL